MADFCYQTFLVNFQIHSDESYDKRRKNLLREIFLLSGLPEEDVNNAENSLAYNTDSFYTIKTVSKTFSEVCNILKGAINCKTDIVIVVDISEFTSTRTWSNKEDVANRINSLSFFSSPNN